MNQVEDSDDTSQSQHRNYPAHEKVVNQEKEFQGLTLTLCVHAADEDESWKSDADGNAERKPDEPIVSDVLLKTQEGRTEEEAPEQGRGKGFLDWFFMHLREHFALLLGFDWFDHVSFGKYINL